MAGKVEPWAVLWSRDYLRQGMDLAQARALLARINRLFDDYADDANSRSTLERDLLREYVRKFYESLDEPAAAQVRTSAPQGRQNFSPPAPRPVVRPPSLVFEQSAPAAPTPVRRAVPTAPPAPEPRYIEVPDSVEEDVRRIEAEKLAPQPTSVPVAESRSSPAPAADPPSLAPTPPPQRLSDLEPALRDLFTVEAGSDLSDRLANAHLPDLTRALALNEMLLAQNLLFGKDRAQLVATLGRLNGAESYEAAAMSLASTARQYDWAAPERSSTARDFIKKVWRHFV